MKHYTKRTIQFAVLGTLGVLMHIFVSRFIIPATELENTLHTFAVVASLLLGAVGFFGVVFTQLSFIINDGKQENEKNKQGQKQ